MDKQNKQNVAILLLGFQLIFPLLLYLLFPGIVFGGAEVIATCVLIAYVIVLILSIGYSIFNFIKFGRQTPFIFLVLLVLPAVLLSLLVYINF